MESGSFEERKSGRRGVRAERRKTQEEEEEGQHGGDGGSCLRGMGSNGNGLRNSSSCSLLCLLLVPFGLTSQPLLLLVGCHLGRVGSRGSITPLVINELLITHDECGESVGLLEKMTCREIRFIR